MPIRPARARARRWPPCPGVLTDADVESLAAHYARQKARAVVYVTVAASEQEPTRNVRRAASSRAVRSSKRFDPT